MRRGWLILGLAALLAAGPAAAADPPSGESPSQLLDEAGEKFMRAIELMLMAIPQYAAPEVLPNGDILIRRKNAEPPKPPEPPAPRNGEKLDRT